MTQIPAIDSLNRIGYPGRIRTHHALAQDLRLAVVFNWANGLKAFDASRYNNIGTLTSGAVYGEQREGHCLVLNAANHYINFGSLVFPSAPTAYSYACWVRQNGNATATQSFFRVGHLSDSFGFSFKHSTSSFDRAAFHQLASSSYVASKLSTSLSSDVWYMFAAVWDGSVLKSYLNGKLETTTSSVTTVKALSGNTEIGNSSASFFGEISQAMLWQRALLDSDIAWLYANRFALFLPNPKPPSMVVPYQPSIFYRLQQQHLGMGV